MPLSKYHRGPTSPGRQAGAHRRFGTNAVRVLRCPRDGGADLRLGLGLDRPTFRGARFGGRRRGWRPIVPETGHPVCVVAAWGIGMCPRRGTR